ncbi:MAG TPA: alpha/beta hydrolase [Chloroflexia bacterium]|nr:alpha/beta hydrolase [Chloroflexia bacterium]
MSTTTLISDLTYAKLAGQELKLDLYRPDLEEPVPAVIYLHGGGWARGDKTDGAQTRLRPLVAEGIAVVAVQYRLAPQAVYPAQIHDVKAAVRWIRAHAAKYGLYSDRIGLWGVSAGAMLASLAGLSSNDPALEGNLGEANDQSSAVQAIVHWFGPTDFVTTATRSGMEARLLPPPFELTLFGPGSAEELATKAQQASPLERVTPDAPPVLIMHGDRDRLVPIAEAEMFHKTLSRQGVKSTFVSVAGAGHDDSAFDSPTNIGITSAFLHANLG